MQKDAESPKCAESPIWTEHAYKDRKCLYGQKPAERQKARIRTESRKLQKAYIRTESAYYANRMKLCHSWQNVKNACKPKK